MSRHDGFIIRICNVAVHFGEPEDIGGWLYGEIDYFLVKALITSFVLVVKLANQTGFIVRILI